MELTLRQNEADLLCGILQDYLSDLRMEIRCTDRHEVREILKGQEKDVKEIIYRLERPVSVMS